MNTGHKSSFAIQTPNDFFTQLVLPQYDDFLANNASSRHALATTLFAYHMYDWVFECKFDKGDFNQGTPEVAEYFEIARQLTNGTKHFKNKVATRVQVGFSQEFSDEFSRPLMIEIDNSIEISADALLKGLIAFWKDQQKKGKF
jgi:hypothetical protein